MAHMRMTTKGGKPSGLKKNGTEHKGLSKPPQSPHEGQVAYPTAYHVRANSPSGEGQENRDFKGIDIRTTFLKVAFKPFSGVAERSLPHPQKNKILALFKDAAKNRQDMGLAEEKLLEAMNTLPDNPFIATRLVCFYKGIGKDRDALEMAQKARNLAGKQHISLEILLSA